MSVYDPKEEADSPLAMSHNEARGKRKPVQKAFEISHFYDWSSKMIVYFSRFLHVSICMD